MFLLLLLAGLPLHADVEHTVAPGESLWLIARAYHVTVDALRDANELGDSDRITAGQTLRVPAAPEAPPSPSPSPNPSPSTSTAASAEQDEGLIISTEIEDPTGEALGLFFAALDGVARGTPGAVARVLHFGDSHTASTPFTAGIRDPLVARFGDAGPGFLQPGKPWGSYNPQDVDVGISGTWTFDRVRRSSDGNLADGLYGPGGFSARSAEPDAAVWVETEEGRTASGFEVEYLAQPGGGSAELLLDGDVVARLDSDVHTTTAERHRLQTEDAAHRFEIRIVGDGEFRLLGLEVERPGPGVLYDVLGLNGARADWLLSWDAELLADDLARRDADLVVLMFGTNEVEDSDLDLECYAEDLHEALDFVHGASPTASCLVLAPPDLSQRKRRRFVGTPEALPQLVELQRAAAREAGCAFFDTLAAMGGPGAMDRWATMEPPLGAQDRVHFTARGYRALGQAIAGAVLRAYDARQLPDAAR
jgi:lysophospholipase L1-like esterase/murein DD-endopeptidase MepM/ murein hydrolase activator NlpD